jgi:hypothetical protein
MNVETKEFWLKVKEEYQPDDADFYICDNSATFKKVWEDISHNRQDFTIIENAQIFLKSIGDLSFDCNDCVLFEGFPINKYDIEIRHKHHIEIRKQFIDHMIQISK